MTDTDLTISVLGTDDMTLVGGGGDDSITGGGGQDIIVGNEGADDLDGGQATEIREYQIAGILDATVDAGVVTMTMGTGGVVLTLNEANPVVDVDATDEDLDILAGAGGDAVGARLAALVNANLVDINAVADAFEDADGNDIDLVSASYDPATDQLTFTFDAGADVDNADDITIATNDTGVSFIISSADIADGSDGGDDTFLYTDAADSTEDSMDQISHFDALGDVIDLTGVGLEPHPLDVVNGGSGYANFAAALADAADEMDFFDANVFVASDGTDTWVFVALDSHDVAVDMVIELVGIDATGIDGDNFIPAAAP